MCVQSAGGGSRSEPAAGRSRFVALRTAEKGYQVREIVSFGVLALGLAAATASADVYEKIEQLAAECRAGKAESCQALADIARTDKSADARAVAVQNLADQALLAEIVKKDEAWIVREEAVRKITDRALLANLAKTDRDASVRRTALEQLTDRALLAEIAKTDRDASVRRAALEQLTDRALLADIAKADKDPDVGRRGEAPDRSGPLAEIAKTDKDPMWAGLR